MTYHFNPQDIDLLSAAIHGDLDPRTSPFASESHARAFVITASQNAQDQEMRDMVAFTHWSHKHNRPSAWICFQLIHDLAGIRDVDPGFSPRTAGYETVYKSGR